MPKKVLIITYYWPPSGGAGVQRWVKFSKYLPESGWEPVILTVDPEYAAYPVTDNSLASEVPGSIKVFKTKARDYFAVYKKDRSKIPSAGFAVNQDDSFKGKFLRFIRGNFFIPDPRRGWNRQAFRKACELVENEGIKHVITTSPPHSTQLIGLRIKKTFPEINWIADLRDPWTDIYYYKQFYPSFISKRIDESYERNVLRKSDRIIVVGESLKQLFSAKVPEAKNKIHVVTNGYDEGDFKSKAPETLSTFTITYVGTLSDIYPITGFLNALNIFRSQGHRFILRFVGMVSSRQKNLIRSKLQDSEYQFISYVDHAASIKYMRESSALLLIIPDHPGNRSIITGKIFEYLAACKPVICLGSPNGDAAVILEKSEHGITFNYSESEGILKYLSSLHAGLIKPDMHKIKKFSRLVLTGMLVKLLNELL